MKKVLSLVLMLLLLTNSYVPIDADYSQFAITTQPVSGEYNIGETAEFKVVASGEGLTYQWYFKPTTSNTFRAATNQTDTYSILVTASRVGYRYYCVITDGNGEQLVTDIVTLNQKGNLFRILEQPVNGEYIVGETATFHVAATGEGLTYQWYFKQPSSNSFRAASNQTDTYSILVAASRFGYQYYCVVTDQNGNQIFSDTVILSEKKEEFAITTQPVSGEYDIGETAEFKVVASGEGLTYQWYFKQPTSDSFRAATNKTDTYTIKVTESRIGYQYYCVLTDQNGEKLTTDTVTLNRKEEQTQEEFAITTQPVSGEYNIGETAEFKVVASGEGLTYQWYFKQPTSDSFRAATNRTDTYTIKVTESRIGYQYYCVLTDQNGEKLTTDTVTLNRKEEQTQEEFAITTQPVSGEYDIGETAEFN